MNQTRNKTAPLTFSGSFEKTCYGYLTNSLQYTIEFLKLHLATANSESHFEGLSSGITFLKIPKKKLNHFYTSALSLLHFILLKKGAWWQSHSGFLRVLCRFKNQYESCYLQFEKILNIDAVYFYVFVLCEGYIKRIYMIWYDVLSSWTSSQIAFRIKIRTERKWMNCFFLSEKISLETLLFANKRTKVKVLIFLSENS